MGFDRKDSIYNKCLQEIAGIYFTAREIDIIACMLNKRSTKKIASMLLISPRTVETHIHNIMIKIGINSKDRIVDFIEKSGKLRYVRQYYLGVLTQKLFETYLQKIASMHKQRIECTIETSDKSTVPQLQKDLKLANVLLTIHDKENSEPCICVGTDKYSIDSMFQGISASAYYAAVFELLQKITHKPQVTSIADDFQKEYDATVFDNETIKSNALKAPLKKTLALSKAIFSITCFLVLIFYTMSGSAISKNMNLRSDLSIPNKKVLLERPDIIQAMQHTFTEKKDGIKTIALTGIIGIGGAGKTTLARYYGSFISNAKIVWELNAEKIASLINSFEDLARALAKKNNERKEGLDAVLNISNAQEKQKQLLSLIKTWLKEEDSWLLIFDNVDNIADIKDYLPQDPKVWGHGNVIITTRNTNIQMTLAQSDIVHIEELTDDEKLTLFSKIYYDKLPDKDDIKKAVDFLKNIPPFPLDVSSAACYLKSTNTSFDQYIKNMQHPNIAFDKAQEALLKESGTYTKTRYNIITTSLQHIIDTRAEFAELALFIGLLNSQNIPKALLESNNQSVDEFIINLKKYSLITSEASSLSGTVFSIHRSTQAIILAYLTQKLDLIKNKEALKKIANALEEYMNALLDTEDYTKSEILLDHYETFLNHNILSDDIKGSIEAVVGGMYCDLEQYNQQTAQLLKNAIKKLEKYNADQIKIARAKAYLGEIYGTLGHYIEAKNFFDDGLKIYQKHPGKQNGFGRILLRLGDLYRFLGKYAEAIDYLKQSIEFFQKNMDEPNVVCSKIYLALIQKDLGQYEQASTITKEALNFYKKDHPEHFMHINWCSGILADISALLGVDLEKTKDSFEECIMQCQKYYGANHHCVAPWKMRLANVYIMLGKHDKAEILLKQSLDILKKNFIETNFNIGMCLLYFGKFYTALGDYEKAKDHIDQCLAIYVKHYGKDHIQTAKALSALGEAYSLKPEMFEQAEKALLNAKGILERENHPDIIIPLELLGDLYAKKADEKAKSIDFYKKALEMGSTYLPKNSVHITRLNKKLGHFKQ